ncbi:MAG: vitamin K epoxide reductase family protein [Nitrosotalea sp.]
MVTHQTYVHNHLPNSIDDKMNKLSLIFFVLVAVGLGVSSYLIYYHYSAKAGAEGWCNINSQINCNKVLLSKYSEIFGAPLGVLGMIWFSIAWLLRYLGMASSFRIGSSFRISGSNAPFYLFVWSCIGLCTVIGLIYLEIFIIGAICPFCTICHILAVGIFIISYVSLNKPLIDCVRDVFLCHPEISSSLILHDTPLLTAHQ